MCTDLTLAGVSSWAEKREADPNFQITAARRARRVAEIAEEIGCERSYIENPRGMLGKLWRPCNFEFTPCEYGGYLPEGDTHPLYPEFIPSQDRYTKRTAIWHSDKFSVPDKRRVDPVRVRVFSSKRGHKLVSPACARLGGSAKQRGADIKSCTPRGWAEGVWLKNRM